jgi:hypothetical protein
MNAIEVLYYIMFIGLLPIAFFWLRRAYLIGIKKDYSFVALKRGVPPDKPEKYAKYSLAINVIAALVLIGLIIYNVVTGSIAASKYFSSPDFKTVQPVFFVLNHITQTGWTAVAGSTIWIKFFLDFALSRQAHLKIKK